jgi:hypothetical protein
MADPFLKIVAGSIQQGGLPYERLEKIRVGSFVPSVTFSGLDGDADGAWLLVGQYILRQNLGDVTVEFKPNGISASAGDTSLRRRLNQNINQENNYLNSSLRLFDAQSANFSRQPTGLFFSYISCSSLRAGPRFIRTFSVQEDESPGGPIDRVADYTTKMTSIGSSNITSFDIEAVPQFSVNGIGPNTEFTLFRVPTSPA